MKKLIFTSATCIVLLSAGYSNDIKGSDYISTDAGSTYNYQRIDSNDSENFSIQTTIQSCSKDKNSCVYVSEMKNPKGEKVPGSKYEYSYNIKDGAVYISYPSLEEQSLLFPATIELGKSREDSGSTVNGSYTNTYKFTKEIPEININNKTYKNCLELEAKSKIKLKTSTVNTKSIETYCKGVGLVKESLKETHNSSKPIVYENILTSITKR